jgi:hypothetical protein
MALHDAHAEPARLRLRLPPNDTYTILIKVPVIILICTSQRSLLRSQIAMISMTAFILI